MIAYMENQKTAEMIENGQVYRKKEQTLLRKPFFEEIKTTMITYVKSENGIRKESEAIINEDHVIARNNQPIAQINGNYVYNEWPIHSSVVIKNYGQEVYEKLTSDFVPFHKKATVKAVLLTQDILLQLGVSGNVLEIKVSWSEQPMLAHLGDYLTSGGYSISQEDMKAYELVD